MEAHDLSYWIMLIVFRLAPNATNTKRKYGLLSRTSDC